MKLNHDVKPDCLVEGQTIVLPAGKLSARDKEILQGIGPGTYRTYPVRAGETIEDIISKRNISRRVVDQLNADANLDNLFGEPATLRRQKPSYCCYPRPYLGSFMYKRLPCTCMPSVLS